MAVVILVRHADIDLPHGAGDDPDLNDAGRMRARALAAWLGPAGVTRIYGSGARRSMQTVAPLAAVLGIEAQVVPGTAGVAAAILADGAEGTALVAGHSNTVPEIIAALGADRSGIVIEAGDFANLFVVSGAGSEAARVLHLTYGGVAP